MKSSAYNIYDVSYRLSMFWSADLHVEPRFDPKLEKHVRRVYLDNGLTFFRFLAQNTFSRKCPAGKQTKIDANELRFFFKPRLDLGLYEQKKVIMFKISKKYRKLNYNEMIFSACIVRALSCLTEAFSGEPARAVPV